MKNKIKIILALAVFLIPTLHVNAADQAKPFKILTQSDSGDFIGQNKSWNFSDTNNSKIKLTQANENSATFNVSSFEISSMVFSFAGADGKNLAPGLYTPAKRLPFRDSYNGIEIYGEGRGCNTIFGAFYVHEYVVNNGVLEKAAIDFVQICEPKSSDINEQSPKLVGSLRYGSIVPDSCNAQGCTDARKYLGLTAQTVSNTPANNTTEPVSTNSPQQTASAPSSATAVQSNEFNQSIVKIRSYELTDYGHLNAVAEGSGVVISAGGIVLTNDHVVSTRSDLDNSLYDGAYQICVVKEVNKKPSCDYLAKVIARNEDKDLALLQIVRYPSGPELIPFKPLKLSASDVTNINDAVTAAGFPAIGEDTITVTSGIVSGKNEKYGNQWIKTDSVVSYGSSGGAALNKDGEIIGITTQVYSDTSGELGYILSVNSINDWVNTNINKKPENSKLFNRLADLTKKQKILEKSNLFINLYPYYSLNKPADWTFTHMAEDSVSVTNENNPNSGFLTIGMLKTPYELPLGAAKARLKKFFNENGVSGLFKFTKEKDAVIGGIKAKQITFTVSNKVINSYVFPENNYLMWVQYAYGKNDQDKKVIDEMIKSIKTKKVKTNYAETKLFKNPSPKYSISASNDWAVMPMENKLEPVHVYNKKISEAYVTIRVDKIGEDEIGLGDDEFINMQKDHANLANEQSKTLDYKFEISKTAKGVKINKQIKAIQIDEVEKNASQNKIIAFDRDYFVKIGNYRMNINLTVYSDNKDIYNKALAGFNKLLAGLKLN